MVHKERIDTATATAVGTRSKAPSNRETVRLLRRCAYVVHSLLGMKLFVIHMSLDDLLFSNLLTPISSAAHMAAYGASL